MNVTIDNLGKRNEVIHGRFYAGNDRSDNLKSGGPGVPDRQVTPDELYDLAELLFELQGHYQMLIIMHLYVISQRSRPLRTSIEF